MDDQVNETVVDVPAEEVTTDVEVVETETVGEVSGDEEGAEPNLEASEDDGYEVVEYDGKEYSLPKELKDAVLRQGDYTRKTQEVAEQRKAFEQQKQQFEQAMQVQQQNQKQYAQLSALDGQLDQYKDINWQKWSEEDPVAAQQGYFQYDQLRNTRQGIAQQIQQQEQTALQQRQQQTVAMLEQGRETLAKEIPGWSEKLAKDIASHGEVYGYTPQEMGQVIDPRAVKVLHDAYLYRQSIKKATSKPKTEVKPVKAIQSRSQGRETIYTVKDNDKWMAIRNKQVAARNK